MYSDIDPGEILGLKTLIAGEVNTGKTRLSLDILSALLESGRKDIAVIDCAPEPIGGVGGALRPPGGSGVLLLKAAVKAPRLLGRDDRETLELAQGNARRIEKLFEAFRRSPREILFINDVSLYLHAGELERVLEVLDLSRTSVINAYYGSSFPDSTLSRREHKIVERIMGLVDRVIMLGEA